MWCSTGPQHRINCLAILKNTRNWSLQKPEKVICFLLFCLLERKRQTLFFSASSSEFACDAFSLPSHSALTGVSSGDNLKYAKSWIVTLYLWFPKPELSALIFDFWEPILQNRRYEAWRESICLDVKGRNECYLFWTHKLKVQEAAIFLFSFSQPCYFSERMLRMGTP